ncbi:MAG: site-specific integrase [Clostridia bacterium]|nr:site-specific integrase [Clostridia bacterium]
MKVCTGDPQYDIAKWKRHYKRELRSESLSDNSLVLYDRVLDQFEAHISGSSLDSVKSIDSIFIRGFLEWLEDQHRERSGNQDFFYNENTKRLYVIILKGLLDYIEESAELEKDGTRYSFAYEFKELNKKKRGRKAKKAGSELKYFNGDEVMNLIDLLDRNIEERGRHYDYTHSLAIRLMLYGGLRVSETLGLKIDDVHIDGEIVELRLEDTKSGTTQFVPIRYIHIEKELKYVLSLPYAKRSSYLVANRSLTIPLKRTNLYVKANKLYAEAKVFKKGLHILRHTSAMMLLEKTNDVTLVQALLRHSSINTTSIYVHRNVKQLAEKVV